MKYKSNRYIDGKVRTVIVDENGKVVNRNPRKEELKDIEKEPCVSNQRYANNQLLEYLKKFYEENGRVPIVADFDCNSRYPSHNIYNKRFGSWNKALKMAGLQANNFKGFTNEELLGYLKKFYEENGRVPTMNDFINNTNYPSRSTYQKHFGSWNNSLKLVGLDVDSMVRKGILETNQQKARLFEIIVLEYLGQKSIDLSGKNCTIPFDGICPKGQTYDAKSARLIADYWLFDLNNRYRKEIEWFYLGAFDKDFNKLLYIWRIPEDFTYGVNLRIGLYNHYRYNVENMKEYEISNKFDIENIEKNF